MKEFSILNGYGVKDTTAREAIVALNEDVEFLDNFANYATPQMFGAVADGTTDDTAAIQAALDSGMDVYFPDGTYIVKGNGLKIITENQKIVFNGGAWIEAREITSGYVLLVNSKFNKLYDVKIRLEDSTETVNAIQLGGVTELLVPTSSTTITSNDAIMILELDKVVSAYLTSAASNNVTSLKYRINNVADFIYKNWWAENQDVTITIEPAAGAYYDIGFDSDGFVTSNTKKTFSYKDLAKTETDEKLKLKMRQYQTYVIAFKKGASETGNNCFTTYLYEPTTTGTGLCGLQVNAAEARVMGGKFRGTKYGINIEAPDFYCENVYTEQCTADGFRARSGSIEAHHVHSYNNAGKGFNLAAINFSNFYGLYADKNIGDGVYIADNSGELNIYGGWGFYSGYKREDQAVYDWNFSNVKDLNLFGCRSSAGDESKVASYNVNATSRVYFYGCMANLKPSIKAGGVAKFMNCHDELRAYNTPSGAYKAERQFVNAGATATFTVYLDEILSEEKDILAFDFVAQYRGASTYTSGLAKYVLQAAGDYENKLMPVIEDENLTISNPTVTFTDNAATVITFDVVNNTEEQLQINTTLNKVGSIY